MRTYYKRLGGGKGGQWTESTLGSCGLRGRGDILPRQGPYLGQEGKLGE